MIILTPFDAVAQIAQIIRERRLSMNMTQAELGQRAGVSLSTLRKFERLGKISFESFIRLIFVLGLMETMLNALEKDKHTYASMAEVLSGKDRPKRKRASSREK